MSEKSFIQYVKRLISLVWVLLGVLSLATFILLGNAIGWFPLEQKVSVAEVILPDKKLGISLMWSAPDTSQVPNTAKGELIRYGHELVTHTSAYLGPIGSIRQISNGLNCQNCHLKAGTVPYGNNYAKVASTYPKRRNRSGRTEGFAQRVNGCFERSLNGIPLDTGSREMKAMIAYLKWVGKDVRKGSAQKGFGLIPLIPLVRAASPEKGKQVYDAYCGRCHGAQGEGKLAENGYEWTYPPLYGDDSYNTGAGLYRISKFAAFVKANMPYGVTFENPFLTDEESWDVAAYVNSMARPGKDLSADWPNIATKPVDHPFGPYADAFSEEQHKYGPYQPIKAAYR